MTKKEKRLVNINLPINLVKQIDEYANKMNLNRTSAIIVLTSTALEQKNAVSSIDKLISKFEELESRAEQ